MPTQKTIEQMSIKELDEAETMWKAELDQAARAYDDVDIILRRIRDRRSLLATDKMISDAKEIVSGLSEADYVFIVDRFQPHVASKAEALDVLEQLTYADYPVIRRRGRTNPAAWIVHVATDPSLVILACYPKTEERMAK